MGTWPPQYWRSNQLYLITTRFSRVAQQIQKFIMELRKTHGNWTFFVSCKIILSSFFFWLILIGLWVKWIGRRNLSTDQIKSLLGWMKAIDIDYTKRKRECNRNNETSTAGLWGEGRGGGERGCNGTQTDFRDLYERPRTPISRGHIFKGLWGIFFFNSPENTSYFFPCFFQCKTQKID